MRRNVIPLLCLVLVLGACGSDKKDVKPAATTTTTTEAASTTTATAAATVTTAEPTTSLAATTTTAAACPNSGSTSPRSTTAAQPAALLTKVAVTSAGCRDSVTFTFRKKGTSVPNCTVQYKPGPFTHDGSGAPVSVAGTAFAVVRCEPAYGYDFASGTPTYTGSKRITAVGAKHVKDVVETGDFEGVVSWVAGLSSRRAFKVAVATIPPGVSTLTITFS